MIFMRGDNRSSALLLVTKAVAPFSKAVPTRVPFRWTEVKPAGLPPAWGLVLDTGSVGQHVAVTAREYGTPAIIATGDDAKRIPDKNRITVDGSKGTVQIQHE
jgi:hypothetical protein